MSEKKPPNRLDDLDARLRRLRERTPKEDPAVSGGSSPSKTAAGFAFRVGIELMAALLVGGGIGWLLDHWLGTMPLFLLIFFFLGAGAGLLNVFRAAKEINRD
ncbi:MAG: synthase protein [Rhodospirillaceae bacterium]|jgi:ATP synthase protein I|nr:synthase protein [Rhodospirillaceae bacterium]